jgi:hypothetical protein
VRILSNGGLIGKSRLILAFPRTVIQNFAIKESINTSLPRSHLVFSIVPKYILVLEEVLVGDNGGVSDPVVSFSPDHSSSWLLLVPSSKLWNLSKDDDRLSWFTLFLDSQMDLILFVSFLVGKSSHHLIVVCMNSVHVVEVDRHIVSKVVVLNDCAVGVEIVVHISNLLAVKQKL